jgi:hypothetical protein
MKGEKETKDANAKKSPEETAEKSIEVAHEISGQLHEEFS